MKKLILAAIVLFVACEPPKYPMCDYCRVPKEDARPFACRECSKMHSSCSKESGLRALDARKDKEGIAVGRSIKVCPKGTAR